MAGGMEERGPIGRVEVDLAEYLIFETAVEGCYIVRRTDGSRVGSFRGSPTSMWLLEPEACPVEVLRSVVHAAIVEGVIVDIPTD